MPVRVNFIILLSSPLPQVGMVLNIVALYVFCFRTKQKTTSVIYTINLAVTDLLVNLSLPPRILLYYSAGACLTCSYLHIFSYFVNMYCSILFLTCICVDRYLAIVQVGFACSLVTALVSLTDFKTRRNSFSLSL